MAIRRCIELFIVLAWFALGIAAPCPGYSGEYTRIRGTVDRVTEGSITIQGKVYDIAGTPIRYLDGTEPKRNDEIRGKVAEILYRNGKRVSVTIRYPMVE
jgi:hypothetical protein